MMVIILALVLTLATSVGCDSSSDEADKSGELNNPSTNISIQLLAANSIEISWLSSDQHASSSLSYLPDDRSDATWRQKTEATLQLPVTVLVVGMNCSCIDTSGGDDANKACFVGRYDVVSKLGRYTIWDSGKTFAVVGYRVCVTSQSSAVSTLSSSTAAGPIWTTIALLRPSIRRPPAIEGCSVWTRRGGYSRVVVDMGQPPLVVHCVDKDRVRLSCDISGSPPARLRWCFNHVGCLEAVNNSGLSGGKNIEADSYVAPNGTLYIDVMMSRHEGFYVLQAENSQGKTYSVPIVLQLTELLPFPGGRTERKYFVNVGEGIRLECRYPHGGSKELKIHWSRVQSAQDPDPVPVIANERIVVGLDGALMFTNTIANDSGMYMCFVSNDVLDRSVHDSPWTLDILNVGSPGFHSIPVLMTTGSSTVTMTADVGKPYTLQCVFSGKPTPHVVWYADGYGDEAVDQNTLSTDGSRRYRLSVGNHSLTIVNVSVDDQRTYRCVGVNSEGTSQPGSQLHLSVVEAPKFVRRPQPTVAAVGDDVTFDCTATGIPPPTLSWLINGIPLTDSTVRWTYKLTSDRQQLLFPNVTIHHNFVVQCNASNARRQHAVASAFLSVYARTTILDGPHDVVLHDNVADDIGQAAKGPPSSVSARDVIMGHVIVFSCSIVSDPSTAVDVTWFRGDRPVIDDGRRVYISPVDRSLVLNATDDEDSGRSFVGSYTCRATNGLTTDSRRARLRPRPLLLSLDEGKDQTAIVVTTSASTPIVSLSSQFGFTKDIIWLLAVGLSASVFILVVTIIVQLIRHRRRHQRRAKSAVRNRFKSLESSLTAYYRDENVTVRHWTNPRSTKSMASDIDLSSTSAAGNESIVHENLLMVGLSSLIGGNDDGKLCQAIQSMYIPRDSLQLGESVGRGQFGRVYSAVLRMDDRLSQQVAVKTLKYKPDEREVIEPFLREAVLMRGFNHTNVLGIVGVSFDRDGSPMVVLPFMAHGDLRRYIMNAELDITVLRLLKMALQVANGMTYLSEMRYVHRDLAARNCMVDGHGTVKVADFGLSRELVLHDYYRLCHNRTPVPVRWMAPESLDQNVFTTMSDVWSFGILMWELITRGAEPYVDIENWQVANYVQSGKRLPQPLYCPDSVYQIMLNCWRVDPNERPVFAEIAVDIDAIVSSAATSGGITKQQAAGSAAASVYTNSEVEPLQLDVDECDRASIDTSSITTSPPPPPMESETTALYRNSAAIDGATANGTRAVKP